MKPRFALVAMLVLAACGDDANKRTIVTDSGYMDAPPDAKPPYWEPLAGDVTPWDIQLSAPYDLSASRNLYVLPLWTLVPKAMTIDYGDGSPVSVPKGALGGQIATMKARRPQPRIVCQFGAGSIDLVSDPDAVKLPGFASNPPDDPTPPAADSVIGWSTTFAPAQPHRRWLDVRPGTARDKVMAVLAKRIELAKMIGCDGILPTDMHMFTLVKNDGTGGPYSGTGFTASSFSIADEQSYAEAVAAAIHAGVLSAGATGDWQDLSEPLAAAYDFEVADRCGETDCSLTRQFLNSRKAVLALDYTTNIEGAVQSVGMTCPGQTCAGVTDGIVKDFPPHLCELVRVRRFHDGQR